MNRKYIILIALICAISSKSDAQVQRETPTYATDETRDVIDKVIKAHGGWSKWAKAPTISFDNIFFNTGAQQGQNPWWVSHEVIEQSEKNRAYQEWPIINSFLAYDGEKTWAKNNFRIGNQPKFMVHFFYYFLNLPWLTQDSAVKLGPVEKKSYGNAYFGQEEREVLTVLFEFKEAPTVGKTNKDYFRLYIDPTNYNLVAYEYGIGFGAMLDLMGLPAGIDVMGPIFRHIDVNTTVDGLVFPAQMHTTNGDQSIVYGQHVLMNYSITKKFSERLLKMPVDARIDNSNAKRSEN